MNHVVVMPVWELLLLVVGVAAFSSSVTGIPCAYFAARRGATNAIRACSAHNDCAMVRAQERVGWTKQLKRQHDELMREHPDALAIRRAAEDVDRAEQAKVDTRTRAQQDIDLDGHK